MKQNPIKVDRVKEVLESIDRLTRSRVLVGIPEDKSGRSEAMTNASIGYIMENGAPEANIPARPHLVPAIKEIQGKIGTRFKSMAKKAVTLGTDSSSIVESGLNGIGLIAQAAVRKKITDGPFIPLKKSTIAARKRKGFSGTKPLIRTGQYRNAISYVIRKT